jgi:hypothetical protein
VKNTATLRFLTREHLQGNFQELRKKIIPVIFLVLLFFIAGFFALTQESDGFDSGIVNDYEMQFPDEYNNDNDLFSDIGTEREIPEWVKPARWFRSNAGGMALEEIPSRLSALRYKYALVIDFTSPEELPEYLFPFYDDQYFIEIRIFYENGVEARTQWIFKDFNGTTRLLAVFKELNEPENEEDKDYSDDESYDEVINEEKDFSEVALETNAALETNDNDIVNAAVYEEDGVNEEDKNLSTIADNAAIEPAEKFPAVGFVEIFNEKSLLLEEIRFLDDGGRIKTEYFYKDDYIISAVTSLWDANAGGIYNETYTDFYRYNRSAFLRAVERNFSIDGKISRLSFPVKIMNAAQNDYFMSEKMNEYPEFFGNLYVQKDSKIKFTTDERGKILSQTLYDNTPEEKIIWVIVNTWSKDRIVSISKTEGDTILLAEYEYDSGGNRTLERNLRNGVLERLVETEKDRDIETLYFNNTLVLQAIWENGRKISEKRINN